MILAAHSSISINGVQVIPQRVQHVRNASVMDTLTRACMIPKYTPGVNQLISLEHMTGEESVRDARCY